MASKLYGMILCATLTVLLTATASRAAIVTSSTAGTLLVDGFENDTVGKVGNSGNLTGWTTLFDPNDIYIENGPLGLQDPLAAYYGSKFLGFHDSFGGVGAYHPFSLTQATGILTAQYAFYLTSESADIYSADDASLFGDFTDTSKDPTQNRLSAQFETEIGFVSPSWINHDLGSTPVGTGGEAVYYDGHNYYVLTAGGGGTYTFTLGAWHVATITDNLDTGALTVNVDGTTLDPMPMVNGLASTNVTGFTFYDNDSYEGTSFADAYVPEPASLGLLAIGGVTLLRRRRA